MIDTLKQIIQDLEAKLLELKAYKKKLLDAEIRYTNLKHYIKEKDLENDYLEWHIKTSSSQNLANTMEYQKSMINKEFSINNKKK